MDVLDKHQRFRDEFEDDCVLISRYMTPFLHLNIRPSVDCRWSDDLIFCKHWIRLQLYRGIEIHDGNGCLTILCTGLELTTPSRLEVR
ncbi:hypothetical protein KIN20_002705 [Parelaphostrongylus tenuis]|uniref:Uncharacterized protein n=1 Tax=Parelaphostrongylus tenuis TaxID=148309 RepID=A0AAD5QDQ1_PARTN|nr:hypothetical protein KIN20_002705 [Parelaphostrongylus tenuis]